MEAFITLPIWLKAVAIIGALIIIALPVAALSYWIAKRMDKLKLFNKVEADDTNAHSEVKDANGNVVSTVDTNIKTS